MRRSLIALYPKAWRQTYGDEFAALLEDTRLTPTAVLDVIAQAAKFHGQTHRDRISIGVAVAISMCFEIVALHAGLTANIVWAPTSPQRALVLAATFAPWAALAVRAAHRRQNRPVART